MWLSNAILLDQVRIGIPGRVFVLGQEDNERPRTVGDPVHTVYLDVVPSVKGPSTDHILKSEVTGWLHLFVDIYFLSNLCYVPTSLPDLLHEGVEVLLAHSFSEGVRDICDDIVEV